MSANLVANVTLSLEFDPGVEIDTSPKIIRVDISPGDSIEEITNKVMKDCEWASDSLAEFQYSTEEYYDKVVTYAHATKTNMKETALGRLSIRDDPYKISKSFEYNLFSEKGMNVDVDIHECLSEILAKGVIPHLHFTMSFKKQRFMTSKND